MRRKISTFCQQAVLANFCFQNAALLLNARVIRANHATVENVDITSTLSNAAWRWRTHHEQPNLLCE